MSPAEMSSSHRHGPKNGTVSELCACVQPPWQGREQLSSVCTSEPYNNQQSSCCGGTWQRRRCSCPERARGPSPGRCWGLFLPSHCWDFASSVEEPLSNDGQRARERSRTELLPFPQKYRHISAIESLLAFCLPTLCSELCYRCLLARVLAGALQKRLYEDLWSSEVYCKLFYLLKFFGASLVWLVYDYGNVILCRRFKWFITSYSY